MPTKLAQLIAHNEGGWRLENWVLVPVPGTTPFVRNNPGDLRHSPHSSHVGIGSNDIGIIDTLEHGWEDLERQLRIFAACGEWTSKSGVLVNYPQGLTLLEMVSVYLGFHVDDPLDANIVDHNNRVPYLRSITLGLQLPSTARVKEALALG